MNRAGLTQVAGWAWPDGLCGSSQEDQRFKLICSCITDHPALVAGFVFLVEQPPCAGSGRLRARWT